MISPAVIQSLLIFANVAAIGLHILFMCNNNMVKLLQRLDQSVDSTFEALIALHKLTDSSDQLLNNAARSMQKTHDMGTDVTRALRDCVEAKNVVMSYIEHIKKTKPQKDMNGRAAPTKISPDGNKHS